MKKLDFEGLSQTLLYQVRSMLPEWLPGGRVMGNEYVCGDIMGGPGNSMKVNITSGRWADFSTDQKGGDLISLYAAIHNLGNGDAFKKLNDMYGLAPTQVASQARKTPATSTTAKVELVPPPPGAALPSFKRKPDTIYKYKGKQGELLFLIARYDNADKKIFTPWSYTAKGQWVKKAWPSPRPLYNLDRIIARPEKPILICEGEKAANAAHAFCGVTYNVTTWPNGSKAWDKVDWSSIYGKKNVLIWPDADTPGRECAQKIAQLLKPHVGVIKVIDTIGFNGGKDAADFAFNNMSQFVSWAKPLAQVFEMQKMSLNGVSEEQNLPAMLPPEPPPFEDGDPGPESPPIQHVTNNTLVVGDNAEIPDKPKQAQIVLWESMGLQCNNKTFYPRNNAANVSLVLQRDKFLKGRLWYDEFHRNIYTTIDWDSNEPCSPRVWDEGDEAVLLQYIQIDIGIHNIDPAKIKSAIKTIPKKYVKNEPKDWMNSLVWDGTNRIDQFAAKYLGCDGDELYLSDLSKNFWISMVARIFKPGCKVDNMLILEGVQGLRKSTALSVIGGKWFAENPAGIGTKDFYLGLEGKLIVEIAELAGFSKADSNKIKQAISSPTDRFRAPYEPKAYDHPRQCVFAGTTNESQYLKDPTGARRFWPVYCHKIDIESLKEDRDQLFAEAVEAFKRGEMWYEEPNNAAEHQESRREHDPWEDLIIEYINKAEQKFTDFYRTIDIAQHAIGFEPDRLKKVDSNRIAACLRALNFSAGKKRVTQLPGVQSGWYIPGADSKQANSKSQNKVLKNYAPQN